MGGRGASIVALDAASGATLWTSGDEPASYTPMLPITIDGQRQVVGYLQHDLVGCDMSTGQQRWKKTLSRGYDEHSAWPIYREPFLWTSAPFQSGSRLWKLNTQQSQEVWHTALMSNDVSSSVLVDGTIYGFDLAEAQSKAHRPSRGAFRAIDFLTGEERWANGDAKTRRPTDFESGKAAQVVGHASLLAADGKLFLLNDPGDLILAQASPDQYVELGRARVLGGEIGWASPALDNGRLPTPEFGYPVDVFRWFSGGGSRHPAGPLRQRTNRSSIGYFGLVAGPQLDLGAGRIRDVLWAHDCAIGNEI